MELLQKRARNGSKRRLKSGRWEVSVTVGRRPDGKPRTVRDYVDTEEQADERIISLNAEMGRRPDLGSGVTLSQWWLLYSAGKGSRVARATFKRYESIMNTVWLPALGSASLGSLTSLDVQTVLLSRPSQSSAHEARKVISAVLGQAVAEGALAQNPCDRVRFEYPGDVGAKLADDAFDSDPFGAIEGRRDVWDARTVMRAMEVLRGKPLESCWLLMVGAGLRREEALALRWRDVRRIEVSGRPVVQVAVHHALTRVDGRHATKGTRSVRIMAVAEPFASRLWSMRGEEGDDVCQVSVSNVTRDWRRMWESVTSKHARKVDRVRGVMVDGVDPPIPYIPLSRMRATHETFMQQAGVADALNAAAHGHSQKVAYSHYLRPDTADASEKVSRLFVLEGGAA